MPAMKLIDSHCHLDRLKTDAEHTLLAYLEAAAEESVEHLLCVSINLEAWPSMRDLVEDYENVSISVGVHPSEQEGEDPTADRLIELASSNDRIVAIGETGLDYYYGKDEAIPVQQQRFREHIRAANAVNKPIIVHTRDARKDTIAIMSEEGADRCRGVMHCFTESWEMAKQALDLGFYISFSGIVTFKNADELREVARKVPQDRLLIETDSPYLAPVPRRGKPNQPAYVRYVAEKIAEIRGDSLEAVAEYSSENFYQLFQQVRRPAVI